MKIMSKWSSLVVVLAMSIVMALPVFAATEQTEQTIHLPKEKSWVTAGELERSGSFSTVKARCHSVYPDGGTDFYSTIQCRVLNSDGDAITENISLKEKSTDYTRIQIKEGYLNADLVTFQFRGNSNAAANAVVSYRSY